MDAAVTSSRIAVGWFESHVEIWDVDRQERVSQFESVLSPGGRRLAISRDGNTCFAAGWKAGTSGGIVAHDSSTGSTLWHRQDISETQCLVSGNDGQTLWCSLDRGSTLKLDILSGVSVTPIAAGHFIAEDRTCERKLVVRHGRLYIGVGHSEARLDIGAEMILSAVFTDHGVCISKAGEATIFFNDEGEELWRFLPMRGSHVTDLHCTQSDRLYGTCIAFSDVSNLGDKTALLRIDQASGKAIEVTKVLTPRAGAWLQDETFVTSTGEVLRLIDGRVTKTLPFHRGT